MGLHAGLSSMPIVYKNYAVGAGVFDNNPFDGQLVKNKEGKIFKYEGRVHYFGQYEIVDTKTLSPLERLLYDID